MLPVLPEKEDLWFRPMLHFQRHAMWQPVLAGQPVPFQKRRISSLTEARARDVADALQLDPHLARVLSTPSGRNQLRKAIVELLEQDQAPDSAALANAATHADSAAATDELLHELQVWEHRHQDREAFEDLRRRKLSIRAIREGQARFRTELLGAYANQCALSDADAPRALEAAHILPFLGRHSQDVRNGLLLRSDLHTLFDDGLLKIEPRALTVEVHPTLRRTVYREFAGRRLRVPAKHTAHPDHEWLAWRYRRASGG
jgi:predicted restriction endonuclease